MPDRYTGPLAQRIRTKDRLDTAKERFCIPSIQEDRCTIRPDLIAGQLPQTAAFNLLLELIFER